MRRIFLLLMVASILPDAQSQSIFDTTKIVLATLVVDYETYIFEGGNLSYYGECTTCGNTALPFTVDYDPPGDFGGIMFTISQTNDTVFDATIIWMGTGHIYHPDNFSVSGLFSPGTEIISKPVNMQYYYMDGNDASGDTSFINAADLSWTAINELQITSLFSKREYAAGVFLYAPAVGVFDPEPAKWIIFLYHNPGYLSDIPEPISVDDISYRKLMVYPNPADNAITIETANPINISLLDLCGEVLLELTVTDGSNNLNISHLRQGVYFIRYADGEEVKYTPVIINR